MSVVSDSPVCAEALSTALLVTPAAQRAALLAAFPDVRAAEVTYPDDGDGAPTAHLNWVHEGAVRPA